MATKPQATPEQRAAEREHAKEIERRRKRRVLATQLRRQEREQMRKDITRKLRALADSRGIKRNEGESQRDFDNRLFKAYRTMQNNDFDALTAKSESSG